MRHFPSGKKAKITKVLDPDLGHYGNDTDLRINLFALNYEIEFWKIIITV